jgi:hypothetical protein
MTAEEPATERSAGPSRTSPSRPPPDPDSDALTRPRPAPPPTGGERRERFWLGAATGATATCALLLVALAVWWAPELRRAAPDDLPRLTRFVIHPVWAWSAPFVCLLGLLRTLSLPPGRRRRVLAPAVAALVTLVTLWTVLAYRA